MGKTDVCPDCWAERTLYDPFPSWGYVAPCLEHITCSGFCMACGGSLDEDLRCHKCLQAKFGYWQQRLEK